MTLEEVEALLGPPGDYTTVPVALPEPRVVGVAWSGTDAEMRELPYHAWLDDSAAIWVGFDASGGVVYADYFDNIGRQQGILRILYRRLENRFWKWVGESWY